MERQTDRGPIRCAVIGYGASQKHGQRHATYIKSVADLELVAVCDIDPKQARVAAEDFPGVHIYTSLGELLKREPVDLLSIVTPNDTHVALAKQVLAAGKHVVVDKPFCFTVAEADALIEQARRADRLLTVFYNRRRDGNYLTIQKLVVEGRLGDLFEVKFSSGGYRLHPLPWRNDKARSGGALYYAYGPHVVDWILKLIPSKVAGVDAYYQKLVWREVSNEDHVRVMIRFANGAVGDISISMVQLALEPFWRINGTRGAIVDTAQGVLSGYVAPFPSVAPAPGHLTLFELTNGQIAQSEVPYLDSRWGTYYADVANHLLYGTPPPVSLADVRRSVAVIEAAERSARSGRTEAVDGE